MANRALVADGASVSTPSGEFGGNVVGRAIDANSTTYWNATATVPNALLLCDLGVARDIHWLRVNQGAGSPANESATAIDVQTSPDNSTWTTVQSFSGLAAGVNNLLLSGAPVNARYWRLDPTAGGGFGWCVRDLEIYDSAPPVGAARVTQQNAEALVVPSTQRARVTQQNAEALVVPTTQRARVSQQSIEVLVVQILVNPHAYAQVIG